LSNSNKEELWPTLPLTEQQQLRELSAIFTNEKGTAMIAPPPGFPDTDPANPTNSILTPNTATPSANTETTTPISNTQTSKQTVPVEKTSPKKSKSKKNKTNHARKPPPGNLRGWPSQPSRFSKAHSRHSQIQFLFPCLRQYNSKHPTQLLLPASNPHVERNTHISWQPMKKSVSPSPKHSTKSIRMFATMVSSTLSSSKTQNLSSNYRSLPRPSIPIQAKQRNSRNCSNRPMANTGRNQHVKNGATSPKGTKMSKALIHCVSSRSKIFPQDVYPHTAELSLLINP